MENIRGRSERAEEVEHVHDDDTQEHESDQDHHHLDREGNPVVRPGATAGLTPAPVPP